MEDKELEKVNVKLLAAANKIDYMNVRLNGLYWFVILVIIGFVYFKLNYTVLDDEEYKEQRREIAELQAKVDSLQDTLSFVKRETLTHIGYWLDVKEDIKEIQLKTGLRKKEDFPSYARDKEKLGK